MVGQNRLVAVAKWLWRAVQTFLNLRDAREVILALASGSLGASVIGAFLSEVRAIPDLIFWPAFIVVSLLLARLMAAGIERALGPAPISGPIPGGPTATTSGANSPAAAATNAPGGTVLMNTGSGTMYVNSETSEQRAAKELAELARLQAEQQKAEQARDERVLWLAGLASLRNVGVARRNQLASLRGDNAEVDALAKYTAWLTLAKTHIRALPVHGPHEAAAFETLDKFRFDAAPAGQYATREIATIAAMFSIHLERIEELRKRYTTTWPT